MNHKTFYLNGLCNKYDQTKKVTFDTYF